MALEVLLDVGILGLGGEGRGLRKWILFFFFRERAIVTAHVQHLFMRSVIVNKGNKSTVPVRVCRVVEFLLEPVLYLIRQIVELAQFYFQNILIEPLNVL